MELLPEKNKSVGPTAINFLDLATVLSCCTLMFFGIRDMDLIIKGFYFIQALCCLLYFLIIPESPRWLFMQNSNSREGIIALNYISWFNGSNVRIPEDAIMDKVGQIIDENKTMAELTNASVLKSRMNVSVQ